MKLFEIPEAEHFCRPLTAIPPGASQSLSSFHKGRPRSYVLREGTTEFEIHRMSLLNAVERWILFGVADYRRAMDMLIPSNAPWAHVTLYYASFFGANAILGMFGCWLDHESMVDVSQGTPNDQQLRISRKLRSPSGFRGSHKIFWDNFYDGCNTTISAWTPASLSPAVSPVNGDRTWQTTTRNEFNYDMHGAYDGAKFFIDNFNPKKLRRLSGSLGQQMVITESMLKLAIHFAKFFKVQSHAYEGLGTGTRGQVFEALVSKPCPKMVDQSEFKRLMFR
jgi:hypothetical protein